MNRANKNSSLVEGIHRGLHRPLADAKRLNLIDQHILELVEAMNVPGVINTIASCEGHGGLGRSSSPYVTFVSSVDLAACLNEYLNADALKERSRLHFEWEVVGRFNTDRTMLFMLMIVAVEQYRWVNRNRLNCDFEQIRLMLQQALDEVVNVQRCEKPKTKRGYQSYTEYYQDDCEDELPPLECPLLSKRIGRLALGVATYLRGLT